MIIEKFEKHDTLNPKLWSNDKLLPEVKTKIIEIIDEFISTIELDIKILDARIVGSQASFNYTEHSDLDVHLITNFSTMDASDEILTVLYNALKTNNILYTTSPSFANHFMFDVTLSNTSPWVTKYFLPALSRIISLRSSRGPRCIGMILSRKSS